MSQIIIIAIIVAVIYWLTRGFSSNQHQYTKKEFAGFILTKDSLGHSELGLFVALVAKLAKSDGRVDELEAQLVGNMFDDISAVFPDTARAKSLLKEIFDEEKEVTRNLDPVANALYELLKNDGLKRQRMIEFMINLTYIDGTLSRDEETMLRTIARYLRFTDSDVDELLSRYAGGNKVKESSIEDAYSLLGLSVGASADEVKKAYRAKVREFHPDIIQASGASEKYLKEATVKVQEINAAYEMIKKNTVD